MEEPRKAKLSLRVASCTLWQTAGSSRNALLQLAPGFWGRQGTTGHSCSTHLPPACVLAGCRSRTAGNAARGRGEQSGNQGSSGISVQFSKTCTDSLTLLNLPCNSLHTHSRTTMPIVFQNATKSHCSPHILVLLDPGLT